MDSKGQGVNERCRSVVSQGKKGVEELAVHPPFSNTNKMKKSFDV